MFPDMTKTLTEKRKVFTAVKQKLQVKYALVCPAILCMRWKLKNASFSSARAAEKVFKEKEQDEEIPNTNVVFRSLTSNVVFD